jgi:O-antigen/teichoic acid export membrane protein
VGVYAIAATATEILWQGPISLAQVQFHRIASGKAGPAELARSRRLWLGGTAVLALLVGISAPVLIDVVVGEEFASAVTPLRILLIGAMAISSYYLDSVTLAARGHTTTVGGISLLGLALVTGGDLLLIPGGGLAGAAWASVGGYLVMAVAARILARRYESTVDVGGAGPSA